MSETAYVPERCPLCGGPNDCGMAAGREDCWCQAEKLPPGLAESVPAGARGVACICRACARSSDEYAQSRRA